MFGTLIITSVAALLVGAVVGVWLDRRYSASDTEKPEEPKRDMNESQLLKDYRREVAGHFARSAALLGALVDNYRNLHDHLVSGAEEFCDDDTSNTLQNLPDDWMADLPGEPDPESVQPPLDYAPRSSRDVGVLNEEFGLEKTPESETAETTS